MTETGVEQFLDARQVLGGEEEPLATYSKPVFSMLIAPRDVRMAEAPVVLRWDRRAQDNENVAAEEPKDSDGIAVEEPAESEDIFGLEPEDGSEIAAGEPEDIGDIAGEELMESGTVAVEALKHGDDIAVEESANGDDIAVEVLRDGDRITALQIDCPCGRHTRLNVEYAKEDTAQ